MKVLSIDVGIKNLGVCIYERDEKKIIYWDVLVLTNKGYASARDVKQLFDKMLESVCVDFVIVEKQPSRNVRMRVIEHMILMYWTMKDVVNISYSSKHKLSEQVGEFKGKKNYRERKKISIQIVSEMMKTDPYGTFFEQSRKKDDLSDSYLQALSYLGVKIPVMDRYGNKYSSRKPTSNQIKKGLSKCNIKYYLVNEQESNLLKIGYFMKAIQKYYEGNIENAKKELIN